MASQSSAANITKSLLILTMGVLALCGAVVAWRYTKLPPELPWLYSLPWGDQQLIKKMWFASGIGGLAIVSLVNYFLAKRFEKDDEVIGLTIMGANLTVVVLYLLSFLQVMWAIW